MSEIMTTDITKAIERAKELDKAPTGPWQHCQASDGKCSCGIIWSISQDRPIIAIEHVDDEHGADPELTDKEKALVIATMTESRTIIPQLVAEVERLTGDLGFYQKKSAELGVELEQALNHAEEAERVIGGAICTNKPHTLPEWRPLSVLTMEVVKRHDGHWAFRFKNGAPEISTLMVDRMEPDSKTLGVIDIYAACGKLPSDALGVRPVDSEGVPVPWAEVGL